MKLVLKSVILAAADLLFPPNCVHCGADGDLFCDRCEAETTKLAVGDVCRRCALPTQQDTCEACFLDPPALDRAIAAYSFDPTIHDAVTALKYKDIRALSPRLGQLVANALPATVRDSIDALIPVPLSRSRLRQRGYNQSELIAREIARPQGSDSLPLETGLLARTLDSSPQAGARSQSERAANVVGAFQVTGDVTDMRILLIDDVMTTGSTLNACAAVLKNAGADWVGALVVAREL